MRVVVSMLLAALAAGPGCKRDAPPPTSPPAAPAPSSEEVEPPSPAESATASDAAAQEPAEELSPAVILAKAVAAHGGEGALRRLGNVSIVAKGLFEGSSRYDARHYWIAPESWASFATHGGEEVAYGIAADSCWERDHGIVTPCDVATVATWDKRIRALRAALLVDLPSEPAAADPVEHRGVSHPAVRVGEVTLAFDPATFLLAEVQYPALEEGREGTMIERRSEYRSVDGVQVPGRVTTSFGRRILTEEEWVEVTPGGATLADLSPPTQIVTGTTVHRIDGPRPVAWTDVPDASAIDRAIDRLIGLTRQRKLEYDATHGLLVAAVGTAEEPAVRVALTMSQGPVAKVESGSLHIETWPARSVAGAYYVGDPAEAWSMQEAVRAFVAEKGLTVVQPERWEVLIYNDSRLSAAEDPVALLQVVVEEPPPGD